MPGKATATTKASDSAAPAFFFTGPMEPFDPKEYRRHLVIFNLHREDCIRLVFRHGDRAHDD